MDNYVLYLDESETFTACGDRYFAIGGVVIDNCKHGNEITDELKKLKRTLWTGDQNAEGYILHEKEISEVHRNGKAKTNLCYNIFRQNKMINTLYAGLSCIIKTHDVVTMGICLSDPLLKNRYPGETNPKLTIALQMLLENYCHFLVLHNSQGDICYESLQDPGNQELRQRFYELEALGTMYYTPHCFQTHIGDIRFANKSENIAGLQLADFIPNTFARKSANLHAKHEAFKNTVFKQAYDGGISLRPKYGMKSIP